MFVVIRSIAEAIVIVDYFTIVIKAVAVVVVEGRQRFIMAQELKLSLHLGCAFA